MAASERGLEPPGQPHQQCGIPAVIIRPPGLFGALVIGKTAVRLGAGICAFILAVETRARGTQVYSPEKPFRQVAVSNGRAFVQTVYCRSLADMIY